MNARKVFFVDNWGEITATEIDLDKKSNYRNFDIVVYSNVTETNDELVVTESYGTDMIRLKYYKSLNLAKKVAIEIVDNMITEANDKLQKLLDNRKKLLE